MSTESDVFFCPFAGTARRSLPDKMQIALHRAGLAPDGLFGEGQRVAVKVHWGEPGNVTFVPPSLVRPVVYALRRVGARPFVTDTNTLYAGHRSDALVNLECAAAHGYTHQTLGAPVLVADGLTGTDWDAVPLDGRHLKEVKVAGAIRHADGIVVCSHGKGHMLFAFGGALKNVGMGCVGAAEKHVLHADVTPRVDTDLCVGCGICVTHCSVGAITLEGEKTARKARIDEEPCTGCGECVVHCPEHAVPINWETANPLLQEKTAEAVAGALAGKHERMLFVNYLFDITRDCDCCGWSSLPLVANIGILVSRDPVAIDQASLDLVDRAPLVPGATDRHDLRNAANRFAALTGYDPTLLLAHAEVLGVGRRAYRLHQVG